MIVFAKNTRTTNSVDLKHFGGVNVLWNVQNTNNIIIVVVEVVVVTAKASHRFTTPTSMRIYTFDFVCDRCELCVDDYSQ